MYCQASKIASKIICPSKKGTFSKASAPLVLVPVHISHGFEVLVRFVGVTSGSKPRFVEDLGEPVCEEVTSIFL